MKSKPVIVEPPKTTPSTPSRSTVGRKRNAEHLDEVSESPPLKKVVSSPITKAVVKKPTTTKTNKKGNLF